MKQKKRKSGGLLSVWIGTFFIVLIITAVISPVGEDGNAVIPDWVVWVDLIIPTFVTISSRKGFKKNKQELSYPNRKVPSISKNYNNKIEILRTQKFVGSGMHHKVYLDGAFMGKIKSGKKMLIGTFHGKHTVLIKGPFNQEASISFEVFEDQIITHIFDELDILGNTIKLSLMAITQSGEVLTQNDLLNRNNSFVEREPPQEIIRQPAVRAKKSIPVKDRDPMEVIRLMESRFEEQYQFAYTHFLNLEDCQRMYNQAVKEFSGIELPLMAQVRFEQLCAEYKEKFSITNPFILIDSMEGHAFEHWCAELLKKNGFTDVEVTKESGDQGVDVLAVKEGIRYAIQCKCYSSDLGNKPVQEVHAGKALYHCQVGVVMTNRHFTAGAKELAEATGVLLWDRDKLESFINAVSV